MEFDGIDLSSFNIKFNLSEFLANGSQAAANQSSDTDDDESYQKRILNYYIMGVGGTSVCCLGIVCNMLSTVVLTRKVMNSSTYSYLAGLAICDLLNLIMTLFLLTHDTKPIENNLSKWDDYYVYLFPYIHPLAVTFQVTSIWLTLAFTVDRYIMICHPFRAEKRCNVSRARKVILGLYIFGFIFNIPRFLEYTTIEIEIPQPGKVTSIKRAMFDYTAIGRDKVFVKVVHSWLYPICVCGIPFLTLAVLNSFLIRAVHESRKKGKQINIKDKKRNDTTVMLIGVIVIFLICQGPALLSRVVYAINQHYATHSMKFHVINEVGNLLVMLNSAINIVPYYLFGKKFRQEFWRLFCKCFLSKDELRRLTRNLSFSIDNRRRISMASNNSVQDFNGSRRDTGLFAHLNGFHKDSIAVPLIERMHDHRGSDQTQLSRPSADVTRPEDQVSGEGSQGSSPIPLRVKWEMDNNKNEKYNVSIDIQPPSNSSSDL